MENTFKNKTVLITGASGRLGIQLAKDYAKLGANLILGSRNTNKLLDIPINY